MADHNTLIGSTAREIEGGTALVGGAMREIVSGWALINGVAREIAFSKTFLVTLTDASTLDFSTIQYITINGTSYYEDQPGTYEVEQGAQIVCYVAGGANNVYPTVRLNGTIVAQEKGRDWVSYAFEVTSDTAIEFAASSKYRGEIDITTQ